MARPETHHRFRHHAVVVLACLVAWLIAGAAAAEPRIYWTEEFAAVVRRAEIDGSGQETILDSSDGIVFPFGIAVDQQGGKIYFTDALVC